jgi:hypothetical protein
MTYIHMQVEGQAETQTHETCPNDDLSSCNSCKEHIKLSLILFSFGHILGDIPKE